MRQRYWCGRRKDMTTTRSGSGRRGSARLPSSPVGPTRRSRTVGLVRRDAARSSSWGRRLSTNSGAVPRGLRRHAGRAGMRGARCRILGTVCGRDFCRGGLVGFRSRISDRTASSRSVDAHRCRSVVRRPRGGFLRKRYSNWYRGPGLGPRNRNGVPRSFAQRWSGRVAGRNPSQTRCGFCHAFRRGSDAAVSGPRDVRRPRGLCSHRPGSRPGVRGRTVFTEQQAAQGRRAGGASAVEAARGVNQLDRCSGRRGGQAPSAQR